MKRRTKKRIEIKASDILRHVLKTGKPFQIPGGFDGDVENDCVPDRYWMEDEFVSYSKAQFARIHRVADSQVSRWVAAGLPELRDGRILLSEGERWLREYRREDPGRRCKKAVTPLQGMT